MRYKIVELIVNKMVQLVKVLAGKPALSSIPRPTWRPRCSLIAIYVPGCIPSPTHTKRIKNTHTHTHMHRYSKIFGS